MAKSINTNEYMYACARIAALEGSIVGEDIIEQLLYAPSISDMILILRNSDMGKYIKDGMTVDEALSKMTDDMYSELEDTVPDISLLNVFRCKYDCNNIKAAIKCEGRFADIDDMLYSCSVLSKEELYKAIKENDFSALPKNMARAAKEASEEFKASKDPQIVDILLDKACYLDMLELSKSDEMIYSWVRLKIDITNLLITMRIIRMNAESNDLSLLDNALLDGGSIPQSTFTEGYLSGTEKLFSLLEYSDLSELIGRIKRSGATVSLSVAEREADNYFMELIKEAKLVSFGAASVAAYITANEYAIRNIRIVFAGKNADLPAELIKERLRENYV